MKIGLLGLGKMGSSIAYRLLKNNYEILAFDPNINENEIINSIFEHDLDSKNKFKNNIIFSQNIEDLAKKVNIIWLMLPAGEITNQTVIKLSNLMQQESIIIDGGNSHFKNTQELYLKLKTKNINFLDCGTSGGIAGKFNGYSLMIGGDKKIFEKIENIFKAIATKNGYNYLGRSGAGHYVKMVHNGIEYSLLQSYAEGFDLLKNNNNYKNLDLEKITDTWINGSVIRSWILELCKNVFEKDQELKNISGAIDENLTGRWTLDEAIAEKINMQLLKDSLDIRKKSRETGGNYGTKVVAMLRNQFGGHSIKKN
ncbi:decarboxylating 6-phosphogluconate dehydrogenase [Candidatus Dependentiae bacterium]|nr:decarboxylating 6-phosphogluconate dehydrogenase [Candidatus Dependentiae bacterium]MBU4387682.1 decarboxylating 6-phosphogluconate dehydrogenase [Candidatus Dependentiae bacterium]MCG2756614.1 decarboxylating 6-phosphogluconate dehydrogenase [Candidatus Dependentiae bacterium]